MSRFPDRIPQPSRRRRLMDWLAPHLPFGRPSCYVSLWLSSYVITPGVDRVIPYLCLYIERAEGTTAIRLFRLPGSKIVELWDPIAEDWLAYPGREDAEQ